MNSGDTIAAISSATGPALRMILRLSGPQSVSCVSRLSLDPLPAPGGTARITLAFRNLHVSAWIYFFKSPRSYTGEDLIELHIPGNPLLAKLLLEELLNSGARSAEPGEFTARAYFNGRLDLAEAEGVAATVSAGNEAELSAARRLMSGELSRRVAPVTELIANTLALLEVGIDFSDEDVDVISHEEAARRIEQAQTMLRQLLEDSARFEPLTHEPSVVLIGRPNAGKSTLLNALVGHERAVVSPVAGTTRDVLSAELALARGMVRLTDVAGLEDVSVDPAKPSTERERIDTKMREAALRALEEADRVILVHDATDERPPLALGRTSDLVVESKVDLLAETNSLSLVLRGEGRGEGPSVNDCGMRQLSDRPLTLTFSPEYKGEGTRQDALTKSIHVSAKTGIGLDSLRQALDALCFGDPATTSSLALNARHVQAIHDAQSALSRAEEHDQAGAEIVAMELREALNALGQIRGQISPDDLLGRIFSAFCIGK